MNAVLVTALILEHPLCVNCVAMKANATPGEVQATLRDIRPTLTVHEAIDRCRLCGIAGTVYSLSRPSR